MTWFYEKKLRSDKSCTHFHSLPVVFLHITGFQILFAANFAWNELVEAIQNHIGSLNWGYRVQLREKSVTYFNSMGKFENEHTIKVGRRIFENAEFLESYRNIFLIRLFVKI